MSIEENGHTNGEMEEVSTRHDTTAEQSFDDLARGAATGTVPRRKALGMLAATLFGGAFVAAPVLAAPRDNRKPGGTGCPKAGQIRNEVGKCECGPGLTPCASGACIDEKTCGGGQSLNTTSCECECASGKVFCGNQCIADPGCGTDQQLDGNCNCECRDLNKEIIAGQCVCKSNTTCTGSGGQLNANCGCDCPPDKRLSQGQCVCSDTNKVPTGPGGACVCSPITCGSATSTEVQDQNTCACVCAPTTVRCGGNCVAACPTGTVRDESTCLCEARITCAPGTCQSGAQCVQGDSNTACGASGDCVNCTNNAVNKVCVNGQCVQCATNAQCGAGQVCSSGACVTAPTLVCTPACSGTTPTCVAGNKCVCTSTSCGTGKVCCATGSQVGKCKNDLSQCN